MALNGVVIAGPFDSQNKIAPYNRIVDRCASHTNPQDMHHYHFSPLCLKDGDEKNVALRKDKQVRGPSMDIRSSGWPIATCA